MLYAAGYVRSYSSRIGADDPKVMNQCPEYVALAWGVTKLLLVANINHSRLKQNIESHLISIGEQLGLVNQLITYSPTDKMVEYEASDFCQSHVLILSSLGLWLLYMRASQNFWPRLYDAMPKVSSLV